MRFFGALRSLVVVTSLASVLASSPRAASATPTTADPTRVVDPVERATTNPGSAATSNATARGEETRGEQTSNEETHPDAAPNYPIVGDPPEFAARNQTKTAPEDVRINLTWDPKAVRQPNQAAIVEQPPLEGMAGERARRTGTLKLAAGTSALICPTSSGCKSAPGAFGSLTLLHRPETWFAWGASFDGLRATQSWGEASTDIALTHHVFAPRVLAELHPLGDSWLDPYFGLGLGVGYVHTAVEVTFRSARDVGNPREHESATTWSPFYAARVGVDLELSERFRVGVVFDWINMNALTGENCPWKAFGACSSSGWWAFPADNAVWKVGAELSFAFGQRL